MDRPGALVAADGRPAPGTASRVTGAAVGAGMPANQATRWMAPASPVFAGTPAPTGLQCPQHLEP
ncbi:hypothetical protein CXG50_08875 [Pseudomonas plecoglossicida]|nr:hypothetical protein CSW00_14825 [Pseudomonas sp. MR 02]PLP93755.1 hypothetical protein CX682_05810 [Pseudomonas sp. FFUP_PS_41]PLU93655.1 hypothetical protein CXG52_23700 [Pseudomonas plecoglossicida]PLV09829.1 hypothetical protein CXG50_08875 [Pseudomonas plecoglossicida]